MNIYPLYLTISLLMATLSLAGNNTKTIEGILFSDGNPVSIQIQDGKIIRINRLDNQDIAPQFIIAPGLIDVQINGYMGVDFSDPELTPEDMQKATKALWAVGVTSFYPTIITNSHENLLNTFERISDVSKDKSIINSIPGFHLEGPFISPEKGFRGAHLEKYIREPNWEEFEQYQKLAKGMIKLVTLSPEMKTSIPFISKCVENGIIVSLGHHDGSADEILKAVDAGASLSTHLGNGCANLINRHHNPLWPQLSDDRLSISIIADGYHLTREEVRTFYKVKGDTRTILVSDALDLAGLEPGEYIRGERKILLTPNVVKFPSENVLAGAASPIKKCVANIMKFTNCSLKSAINMASLNPAELMGLELGEIRVGKRADIILFQLTDDDLLIEQTYVAGKLVYKKPE